MIGIYTAPGASRYLSSLGGPNIPYQHFVNIIVFSMAFTNTDTSVSFHNYPHTTGASGGVSSETFNLRFLGHIHILPVLSVPLQHANSSSGASTQLANKALTTSSTTTAAHPSWLAPVLQPHSLMGLFYVNSCQAHPQQPSQRYSTRLTCKALLLRLLNHS